MLHSQRLSRTVFAFALLAAIIFVTSPAAGATENRADTPLVVVGMAGVTWEDVESGAMPAAKELAEKSAIGSLIVRSVRAGACPADGWLALNAGARRAEVSRNYASDLDVPTPTECGMVSTNSRGKVSGWDRYRKAAGNNTDSLGSLNKKLTSHRYTSLAIGDGAAIALANAQGQAHNYRSAPSNRNTVDQALRSGTDLIVIDAGVAYRKDPKATGTSRSQELAAIDRMVSQVMPAVQKYDANIVVASLADDGGSPQLRAFMGHGPWFDGVKSIGSTRSGSADLIPVTNLRDGILQILGAKSKGPLTLSGHSEHSSGAIATAQDTNAHFVAVRALAPIVMVLFLGGALAVCVLCLIARTRRRTVRLWLRVSSFTAAAIGPASFISNLVPWWRLGAGWPPIVGLSVIILIALALALIALAGPWRGKSLGPAGFIGALTALALLLDPLFGTFLGVASPLGIAPLNGGRFHGLTNTAFALAVPGAILLLGALLERTVEGGRRAIALAWTVLAGIIVLILDAAPQIGADFGGAIPIVLAFGTFGLLVAGIRLTWPRVIGLIAVAALAALSLIFLDYARGPENWTHIGAFGQDILNGRALPRIVAKAKVAAVLFLPVVAILALAIPIGWKHRQSLSQLFRRLATGIGSPTLRPVVCAIAVTLMSGALVNDSSAVILAVGVAFTAPMLLAGNNGHRRDKQDGWSTARKSATL